MKTIVTAAERTPRTDPLYETAIKIKFLRKDLAQFTLLKENDTNLVDFKKFCPLAAAMGFQIDEQEDNVFATFGGGKDYDPAIFYEEASAKEMADNSVGSYSGRDLPGYKQGGRDMYDQLWAYLVVANYIQKTGKPE